MFPSYRTKGSQKFEGPLKQDLEDCPIEIILKNFLFTTKINKWKMELHFYIDCKVQLFVDLFAPRECKLKKESKNLKNP